MKKEERDAEAERAAERQNMINKININDFLREQRNQARMVETGNEPSQDNIDDGPEGSQSQNHSDIEYEYVTCHDNLAYKVNEGKIIPRLVSYEIESEVESEQAISPLVIK